MARSRGSNTGRGNYPASKVSGTYEAFKQGVKGIKIKHPNRHMSETEYKRGLKKEPESNE